ncbi:SDR family oxidoreductase [Pedobacter sp. AW31-3R]|uniref:SDR family oxidoreductase n=1 Tax=Pedobacter sp. AW31-3R TaxID=3445781 RepID=UPI003F9FB377
MNDTEKKELVLVTGGTGFVGIHTIIALLNDGYTVRTTVRSLGRQQEVLALLEQCKIANSGKLTFVEADLTSDDNWDLAVAGCTFVLHVASPFPAEQPKDENELIVPARDGALRVLRAARNAGVKRVVLTSSFAAVGYSIDPDGHTFTEEDWTDERAVDHPYIKSKTIAEKAAWDFMAREGGGLELTVMNPVGIFGPAVGKDYSSSIGMVKSVLEGEVTTTPPLSFGVVDVRDVARLHLLAMNKPEAAGERFIVTADGTVTFYEIAALIKKERPGLAGKVAGLKPNAAARHMVISNEKAKSRLDWTPITMENAILASVDTIAEG